VPAFLLSITLRQLAFRKSTLGLLALAALPVLLGLLFRLSNADSDPQEWTARVLYVGLVLTLVLPLTAVMFGVSVLGDELEDGTAVYLLTKPLPRWQLLAPKVIAVWLLTAALTVTSSVIGGLLAMESGDRAIVTGAAVAVLAGSLAYSMLFVLLSLVTTRALIAGLVYIFIWEGAMAGLFEGVRYLSIRHYTIGIADWVAGEVPDTYEAYVDGGTTLVLTAIVTAIAALLANRRLEQVEIREAT
jgi:ABC-2 type transport system permease protein